MENINSIGSYGDNGNIFINVKDINLVNRWNTFVDTTDYRGVINSLNREYTLDNLIFNNCFNLDYIIDDILSTNGSLIYFIHGDSGSGKTHLIHGIAQELYRKWGNPNILLLNNYDIEASYEDADIVLIEDFEYWDSNELDDKLVTPFLNNLIKKGKRVILTSVKSSSEFVHISPSLRSLLDMTPEFKLPIPNYKVRKDFVKKYLWDIGIEIMPEALNFICYNDLTIGQLKGVLQKLTLINSLTKSGVITMELVILHLANNTILKGNR